VAAVPVPDLERLAAAARRPIKDEPGSLVERLGEGADAVVRKTYRNRGLRLLQTCLRRSRANREFDNLTAVAAAGLPCTAPLAWSERRCCGFVRDSTLVTRYLPESRSLKSVLQELPAAAAPRRRLVAEFGALLARLHASGFLWCTPMPRNVLLQGSARDGRLVLCDLPSALRYPAPVPPRARLLDLFDAACSPSRRRELSRTERFRCLLAYARSDRARTRQLWRALRRRSLLGHRLRRSLVLGLRLYILARIRPPAPPGPR
jgi:hypothetical protein